MRSIASLRTRRSGGWSRGLALLLGVACLLLVGAASASASVSPPASFLAQFGGSGSGNGTFNGLSGVAVDPSSGAVYVPDHFNNLVQKFTAAGAFVSQFGGSGPGNGTFNQPFGVAVDPSSGAVYVADTFNSLVQKFTAAGGFVSQFGGSGSGNGTFDGAFGVTVDPSCGAVYVTDSSNNLVQKFTAGVDPHPGVFVSQFGGPGPGNGTFNAPFGVAVDPSSGAVYVTDSGNDLVQKFTAAGAFVSQFGGPGPGHGTFNAPFGVAVDSSSGAVYVTDSGNDLVQKFTAAGAFVSQFGGPGSGHGRFNYPFGVAVDPFTGVIYVADSDNLVQLFGVAPVVSGSPVDGATVYASRPSQVGRGPFSHSYQWLDCPVGGGACVNNGVASSSNGLRLKPSDEGQLIEVMVTQTSPAGSIGPVASAPVGPVLASPPVDQSPPVISGSTADGSVLSATHGAWSGVPVTSYAYQWQSCAGGTCGNVGTNQAGYRLQPSDVGHTIQVQVSATNPDATAGPVTSLAVGPVSASPPVNTTPPSITGTYAPGSRLSGHAGTWSGVLPITYTYQWQRCPDATAATCANIPGATVNNYLLTAADTHVRLAVSASNPDGGPVTAYSAIAPLLIGGA